MQNKLATKNNQIVSNSLLLYTYSLISQCFPAIAFITPYTPSAKNTIPPKKFPFIVISTPMLSPIALHARGFKEVSQPKQHRVLCNRQQMITRIKYYRNCKVIIFTLGKFCLFSRTRTTSMQISRIAINLSLKFLLKQRLNFQVSVKRFLLLFEVYQNSDLSLKIAKPRTVSNNRATARRIE